MHPLIDQDLLAAAANQRQVTKYQLRYSLYLYHAILLSLKQYTTCVLHCILKENDAMCLNPGRKKRSVWSKSAAFNAAILAKSLRFSRKNVIINVIL